VFKLKYAFGLSLVILTTFSGCSLFDQSDHQQIIGEYEVGWNDLVRNRSINKPEKECSGCFEILVGNYVYAVGHNDSFIIAKQHFGSDTLNTYYYIIDINKQEKRGGRKGVYESLSKRDFDSLRKRLNISHIPFDMNYPENP